MKVLIIEDEKALARLLEVELTLQGKDVVVRYDGKSGLLTALEGGVDLVLLDWMLPDLDGIEVCRILRSKGSMVPIIMITAKQGVSYEVEGLHVGADDYITKPFDMEQLLARMEAVLRRTQRMEHVATKLVHGQLVVDTEERRVSVEGRQVHLTKKEYDILLLLLQHRGKILTKEQILEKVWGPNVHLEEGVLSVHITSIRSKLKGSYIENIRGIGYIIPRYDET
ncbi:MAG: response regulator transcription factor [Spirochaetes bacterium]|nr:response regulator transcription factor [Spirochaetota bacterium]